VNRFGVCGALLLALAPSVRAGEQQDSDTVVVFPAVSAAILGRVKP
jgi:hypothetical protein